MSASSMTLPADPEKAGNSWCAACEQSISNGRVAAHLVSKKHIDAAQKRGAGEAKIAAGEVKAKKATAAAKTSPTPSPPSDTSAPKTKKASRVAKAAVADVIDLPRDPKDAGRYWCNICKASLDATRAAVHLDTDKHQRAEEKYLTTAMRGVSLE